MSYSDCIIIFQYAPQCDDVAMTALSLLWDTDGAAVFCFRSVL